MRTFNRQIATATALNANSTSAAVQLKNILMYSIMCVITGTPTGTITLEGSNDPETNDTMPLGIPRPVPTNWATIKDSNETVTAAGNVMYNVHSVAYNYVRVIYTDASAGASTAVMSIIVNGKGV